MQRLEVSGAVRLIFKSLGVKGLTTDVKIVHYETNCILKRKKNGEYRACLKYSVPTFVE